MNCVIYKIVSPSGKIYIGQSVDFDTRISKYRSMNCKGQPRLYASFLKYGFDQHVFSIVESVSESELNNREAFWQEFYDVISDSGLNCKIQKSTDKSGKLSKETKYKISKANKGRKFSQETLKKMSEAKIGKKMPEHQRLKMIGRKQPEEQVNAARARMRGNSYTKGVVSHNARKVIDESTGVVYDSIFKAAEANGIKRSTLRERLKGTLKNNTTLRYL